MGGRRPFKPKADDNAKGKWLHHRLKVLKKVSCRLVALWGDAA